ncbi:MAG: hypothetical protein JNJ83_08305 [Verrucomicrobiaceae bacterium]|nr:hypothetical protein [Verrucomicrobiaceae bacterium]
MRRLLLIVLATSLSVARAGDDIRVGQPKDCYLYCWGKGPNGTARIGVEFRLSLLDQKMPSVDDRYSDPADKSLNWVERKKAPQIKALAEVDGRRAVEIVYPEAGAFGKTVGMVIAAIETSKGSGWFSPFFVAQPELFRSKFISGRDVAFGYVATLEWSGTGSMRCHYLFDLRKAHPSILTTLSAGRIKLTDYKTEAEYQEALKVFDVEADLLAGKLQQPKAAR